MRNTSKYMLMAAMAALALVSCKKEKTPEGEKEETKVTYTFSATATSETEADLKVVASAAVPEDVKVAIAVGEGNSIPEAALTFPKELVIAKGKTEAAGKVSVDKEALEPGNGYKAALTASVDGKAIGSASVFSIDIPEPEPQGIITIDGNFDDWAEIEGVSEGTYSMFKATSDEKYIYFYTWRTTDERYSEIWNKNGYVYFAFDLDGDETTGVELWGNGPYEFVGVSYPFAGSAEAPAINENPGDACMPDTATFTNMECKGLINEEGVFVEFRVPRSDLPAIPNTPVTVISWGNKGMAKAKLTCTL